MNWSFDGAFSLSVVLVVLLAAVFSARGRSGYTPPAPKTSHCDEEIAILRAEVKQLREEVERLKQSRGVVRSSHIQEG